jgi:hypothetical protein
VTVDLPALTRWRDSLIESRLSGIREVTDQNGEKITYKGDGEMQAALNYAENLIASFNRAMPRTIMFCTSKGL